MKRNLVAVFMLAALTAWIVPVKTAIALKQKDQDQAIFINYQAHRKDVPRGIDNSKALHVDSQKTQRTSRGKVARAANNRTGTPGYNGRHYSVEEVKSLIISYSEQYGISPETPICIAGKESGYNQFSKNNSSSASGVFQYLTNTWTATDEGKAGLSVFDADANVKAAIKYMASRKSTQPWAVRNKCPKVTPL